MARPKAIRPVNFDAKYCRIIVYGEPGTGKSVFAGSGGKTLILASDEEETISAAIQGSTADMWHVKTWDDVTEAYEYLRHEDHGYEWVWLDNGTLFEEQGMDDIMETLVAAKPHRSRFIPDMAQYLENMNRFGVWIRDMKSLPIHFGMTAHVMMFEDEKTGDTTCMPMLGSKKGDFSQKACGYMNIIGYMTRRRKDGEQRSRLQTIKSDKFYAKDRFDCLGNMEDPSIPKMMEKIARQQAAKAKAGSASKAAPRRTTATKKSTARS